MKYLLDTCTMLWFFEGNNRISSALRDKLTDPRNEVYVSYVSFLETVIKYQLKKLPLSRPPSKLLPSLVREHGLEVLALNAKAIFAIEELPPLHRDPFDRLLIAQAKIENAILATPDPLVRQYALRTEW